MINSIDEEFEKYNETHCACPTCGAEEFTETTQIAFVNPKNNPNKHVCKSCGWVGYQRDLLPKSAKIA